MALAAFALFVAVAGAGFSEACWRRLEGAPPPALERLLSAGLLASGAAVAISWALALPHLLTSRLLLACGGAAALLGLLVWRGSAERPGAGRPGAGSGFAVPGSFGRAVVAAALLPPAAWLLFIAWRGWLLPPLTEDALIYHLPKALFLARAGGFEVFTATDIRISSFPANYELLLADVLLLSGSDRVTEWLATGAWIGFSLAGAAFAERWWGPGLHTLAAGLVAAGTRIALLQSGAHKHDIVAAFFCSCALLWTARWGAGGGRMPAGLAITALALAAGTKVPTGPLVLACALVAASSAVRRFRAGERPAKRDVAMVTALGVGAFLFLGGVAYLENAVRFGSPFGPNPAGVAPVLAGRAGREPGGLLVFPLLLFSAPFSGGDSVTLPGTTRVWWWPQDDLNLSHFGLLVSFLALALPFCALRYRKATGGDAKPRERHLAAVAAGLAFCAPALVKMPLPGSYAFCARYVVWVVPVIAAMTIAPVVRELCRASPREVRLGGILVLGIALFFAREAVRCAVHDSFAPFTYVREIARHPESRRPFRTPRRAAIVADELAGPDDVIAMDSGHDSWIYPAFGASLSRTVLFLGSGPVEIPPEARFVAVDRYANILWGHPALRRMSDADAYLAAGSPSEEDLRVFRALEADPRFELLFHDSDRNQAVFRRRLLPGTGRGQSRR